MDENINANEPALSTDDLDDRIAAIRKRAHRSILLDGNLQDAIKGMNGIMSERNTAICAWGCRVVANYARLDAEARQVAIDAEGLPGVLRCLDLHPTDADVARDGLTAVRFLCEQESVSNSALDNQIATAALTNLTTHMKHATVVQPLAQLIRLLVASGLASDLHALGLAALCLQATVQHAEDRPTIIEVLHAVDSFARHDDAARALFASGDWIRLTTRTFELHVAAPDVLAACMKALAAISRSTRSSLAIPLVALFKKHTNHVQLASAACEVIACLARQPAVRLLLQAQNVFHIILGTMKRHKDNADLVLYACWALVELSSQDGDGATRDAVDSTGKTLHQQVTDTVLGSMVSHRQVADVQRYGTKALENLAQRSEEDRTYVAQSNGVQVILLGLHPHKDKPIVLSNGFHALAVIASDDDEMHVHIAQMRAVETTAGALKQHPKHVGVATNSARLLANLAMNALVRREVVKQGCPALIVAALAKHASSSDLQYYGFRFLDNLATEADVRQELQQPSFRKTVHASMLTFHQDVDVLLAACCLTNRLAYDQQGQAVNDPIGTTLVASCLVQHTEEDDLVGVAACTLSSLLLNVDNRKAFEESKLLAQVWPILQQLRQQRGVQLYLCGIVSSLAFDNDVCTQALHALDAATWLLQLVEDNPQDTALLRAALAGLRNLSSNLVPHRRAVINAKAVPRCIEILRNQLGQPELAFWCCAVLANCCREADAAAEAASLQAHALCQHLVKEHDQATRVVRAAIELRQRLPEQTKRERRDSIGVAAALHVANTSGLNIAVS